MKLKIVENSSRKENQLWQISTDWCLFCWDRHRELHVLKLKHVYVDPEKKFVTKHFKHSGPESGDIKLAQQILSKIKITGFPTFVVYKTDGTLSETDNHYDRLVKKYNIPTMN